MIHAQKLTRRFKVRRGGVVEAVRDITTDAAGVRAVTATSARPTLADVFLALTGRSLREDEVAA